MHTCVLLDYVIAAETVNMLSCYDTDTMYYARALSTCYDADTTHTAHTHVQLAYKAYTTRYNNQ
jgi:hypothetical protein